MLGSGRADFMSDIVESHEQAPRRVTPLFRILGRAERGLVNNSRLLHDYSHVARMPRGQQHSTVQPFQRPSPKNLVINIHAHALCTLMQNMHDRSPERQPYLQPVSQKMCVPEAARRESSSHAAHSYTASSELLQRYHNSLGIYIAVVQTAEARLQGLSGRRQVQVWLVAANPAQSPDPHLGCSD